MDTNDIFMDSKTSSEGLTENVCVRTQRVCLTPRYKGCWAKFAA